MSCLIDRPDKLKKVNKWTEAVRDYWCYIIDECDLGIDFDSYHNRCWRCGCKRKLQKCHIIPDSVGGSKYVNNIIPLCLMCHDESPDVNDTNGIWKWIKNDHGVLYDTYWFVRAFNRSSVSIEHINDLFSSGITIKDFDKVWEDVRAETVMHWNQHGAGAKISEGTYMWIIEEVFNRLNAVKIEKG